ncbi:hypothetical protein DFH06DRAFT_1302933 [Mycena polygramma]|nr:hypothetical protein DFH06DRAFT_1302933 [Mycena polygramma]
MDDHLRHEPVFPTELEREIFETILLRVARRVLLWIEPFLYRIIRVNNIDLRMIRAPRNCIAVKPAAFFHGVRHIMLEAYGRLPLHDVERLVKLCTKLTSFAVDFGSHTGPELASILDDLRVQCLRVVPSYLDESDIDLQHRLFQSVTHLDLSNLDDGTPLLGHLPKLAALTHVSWHGLLPGERVMAVLDECPRLLLWLNQCNSLYLTEYNAANTPRIYDVRFVIRMYDDYWTDWEANAKGLSDFWSQADDFVARKRRGEIEGK